MSDFWMTFLTTQAPLITSLLVAVIGLIMTALKYKKQKYEIAMIKEQNEALKFLTPEQIATLQDVAKTIKERK